MSGPFMNRVVDIRKKTDETVEDGPVQELPKKTFTEMVEDAKAGIPADLHGTFLENLSSEVDASVERAALKTITTETDQGRYIRDLKACWIDRDKRIFDDQKANLCDSKWDSGRFGLNWHVCLNKGMLD